MISNYYILKTVLLRKFALCKIKHIVRYPTGCMKNYILALGFLSLNDRKLSENPILRSTLKPKRKKRVADWQSNL